MTSETSFELRMIRRRSVGGFVRIVTLKTLIIFFDINMGIRKVFNRWSMHTEIIAISAAGIQYNNKEQRKSDYFSNLHFLISSRPSFKKNL